MSLYRGHKSAPRFVTFGRDSAVGVERKLRIDGHQFLVAEHDHGVRRLAAREAVLPRILRGRQGIFKQPLQGDFAQGPSRLGPAQNAFECLGGLGHLLSGQLDGSELFLNLADLVAGVPEFVGHPGLSVGSQLAGNLSGILDGVLQGWSNAIQALRDALGDGFHLADALTLRGRYRLQVPAQITHLRFKGSALLPSLRTLQYEPKHQHRHNDHRANQNKIHSLSNSFPGNGILTLLALATF